MIYPVVYLRNECTGETEWAQLLGSTSTGSPIYQRVPGWVLESPPKGVFCWAKNGQKPEYVHDSEGNYVLHPV